jgi:hypothetical protein
LLLRKVVKEQKKYIGNRFATIQLQGLKNLLNFADIEDALDYVENQVDFPRLPLQFLE